MSLSSSPSIVPREDSLSHMAVSHSFFIPDIEYLQDLHGLLMCLGKKVAMGNVFYNGKGCKFQTIEAVRKHITTKIIANYIRHGEGPLDDFRFL